MNRNLLTIVEKDGTKTFLVHIGINGLNYYALMNRHGIEISLDFDTAEQALEEYLYQTEFHY